MEFKTLIFYALAAILIFAALRVITARNPVHAVLHLILAFFTAAGIWLLLQAEFLALALVMVYIGAVMVLFLFVVMMLDISVDVVKQGFWRHLPLGVIIGLVVAAEMGLVLGGWTDAGLPEVAASASNTRDLGALLVREYVYPFELTAAILLMAIVAAVALTFRGKKPGSRNSNPADQIRVKAADRMRIVKMQPEIDLPVVAVEVPVETASGAKE
ncbi:NADH-quinone oxidoreductase subunit J [Betaproteobacteria bacterium]|nr:NADH-quinone oxidoreductase subunit J [Betaproteobacteria bacterium]GHU10290.1 NADH-quinone oxidoreductase subunit J [Betaproteobacteria bacterium]GHU14003.1 NADH-quinone oxidoreductase subunit J [Betaproteobacteria bacterium]GHU45291.1 NADH-quinone oxidoreductase subunit J [Betaproteobacteria bacterium]